MVSPLEIAFFRFINRKFFASGGRETKHVRFSDPPDKGAIFVSQNELYWKYSI